MGIPSVHPTGTTIYDPQKCFNGFTVFEAYGKGVMLIDMNGREIHLWENLIGMPAKILKGGYVLGSLETRPPQFATTECKELVQVDWDGNIVWKFDRHEYIEDPGESPGWQARYRQDCQREGNPVGYYTPELECKVLSGNTLLLCHKNVKKPGISLHNLIDDGFVEVDWAGNIVWQWWCSDHYQELGFSEAAKNAMARNPNLRTTAYGGVQGDWMHINSMSVLGPNPWYDAGDERFHPDNIIWDARETNIIGITSKKTGEIVWKIGPYYDTTPELKKLGWIIGQHHAHMIPKGLEGAGNILVFDNGGQAGYGDCCPSGPSGVGVVRRDYSRVLEFNPLTLEIVWQYTPEEADFLLPLTGHGFYSMYISSAQRLPNGNTLIVEGSDGRFIEVTKSHEIVWEYINPYDGSEAGSSGAEAWFGAGNGSKYAAARNNYVYRAYRVPYDYCPQATVHEEIAIPRIDIQDFRLPGAAPRGGAETVQVAGAKSKQKMNQEANFCLPTNEQAEAAEKYLE